MANPVASAPSQVHVRPLLDVFRPTHRRQAELLPLSHRDSAWDALSLICNQQLSQDALLLWRYDRARDHFGLLASAPSTPWETPIDLAASEALSQLASERLEAVAHVNCALSDCPLEQTLWQLGLHAGVTTVLTDSEQETLLITFGFRERWHLVAHNTSPVVAMTAYLRTVHQTAFPSAGQRRWWDMLSLVPHLWRQPYRPSVMRTVYDLNEMLSDLAERAGAERASADPRLPQHVARLAHKGADLMARLENVYWDPRAMVSAEEFLSEAVLLVRGAYQICLGDWPGCLAATTDCPTAEGSNPTAIRHALVDWILAQMSAG